jgi:integrase
MEYAKTTETTAILPEFGSYPIDDRCLRKAKLRLTRVHDARHCFASWNLSAGASLFRVSRQMGHSSIKVTADPYGKYIPTQDRTAANLLDTPKSATQAQPTELQVQALSPNA